MPDGRVLITAADARMAGVLAASRSSLAAYAARHGYQLTVDTTAQNWGREAARWRKLTMLREALTQHQLALWIDADAVICRHDRDIADDLPPRCFQGLVLERFPDRVNPNTGVWVLRGDPIARELLDTMLRAGPPAHSWTDQAALCLALGWHLGDYHGSGARPGKLSRFARRTAWLPGEWNVVGPAGAAGPGPGPGPALGQNARIRHFAGMDLARREAAIHAVLAAHPPQ
jgi:hypothetical protein